MAYIVPSVEVFQQLENAGGVLNTTPDLDTCIIGPAFNILTYDGTVASQVKTAALSTVTTTGDITAAGFTVINVAAPGSFSVGDRIQIIGAGASGSNLQAKITVIAGNVFTLDTAAGTTVVGAVISKQGQITNSAITNTFALPAQKPGQVVTLATVTPWFNATAVETVLTGFYGYYNNNLIVFNTPTGVTGSITGGLTSLVVTTAAMATQFSVGDSISIANAGAGGVVPHVATITNIVGTTFTVTPAAITTATTQAVTKNNVANLNSTTNTLRAEAGDAVHLTATSIMGTTITYDTKILTVVTSSGANGNLVNFSLNDNLPATGWSTAITTGTVGAGSTAMTVALATGFATGDTIQIIGAGVAGATLETTITVSGLTFTLGVAATTAVTNAKVAKVLRSTAGISSGSTTLTTIAGSGNAVFNIGDRVVIKGAGAGGADFIALISATGATSLTFATTPTITTTSTATDLAKVSNIQISVRKTYNNQQVALTKPISGGANFDTSTTAATGQVVINANPEVVYGKVISADVYFAYNALRTDLAGTISEFSNLDDVLGTLGVISDANPLALALSLALANTTGRVFGIGIGSNDLTGHSLALSLVSSQRMYCLVPLTQDTSIIAAYQVHVDQLSLPQEAGWRIALVNTAIPTSQAIGQYTSSFVNSNGGNNTVSNIAGNFTLTASNATFISDGVVPGDSVHITASTPGTIVGTATVLTVVSNQQLVIQVVAIATAVSYYVTRTLTKAQQATAVAATSATFNDKRITHIQPDLVGIEVGGTVKYLPGYYLCAATGGMVSGFPVQQGFTNIGVAGISDLKNSNFYFSKTDLGTMASSGTFIYAQATQGGIPYCRHELTTDISVLQYRELLVVKNWDFLSYYFHDKLEPFIGSWNITKETLNTIRQSIVASAESLLSKKLPKIGAPLLSYNIRKLEQDATNQDSVNCELLISVVYPLNYLNLFLII